MDWDNFLRCCELQHEDPGSNEIFNQRADLNENVYPHGVGMADMEARNSVDSNNVKRLRDLQWDTSIQSRFTSDFTPIECIGTGSFGCVIKAMDKMLKKYYAVKIVRCHEKCLREAEALSDLHHRNIVRYYTSWMDDSEFPLALVRHLQPSSSRKFLYIQMELCDTKTLRHWINKKNTDSLQDSKRREESLSIALQILSGVEYIHLKKHIHRDLKPENILFGLDGELKIGDFGLVTIDDKDEDSPEWATHRTPNIGTPIYRAPEQREEKYDRKVDIFPLGLIYLELLWNLSTDIFTRVEVMGDARSQRLPKEFSQAFPQEDQIIRSMLRKKPRDRPEASTLRAELDKWTQTCSAQNQCQDDDICLL
ncbi:interferon-induced, double-stranded RNA-activated protein kinase-like isoform X2 [Pempheris klunzingeri]|uniref:interferon-induced, double-stranded RNA-activated protein kinase-like isoform X2 n=1 Tax=Pempheris klunzingeri TaxID=3127111 RepID=UPI00397FCA35